MPRPIPCRANSLEDPQQRASASISSVRLAAALSMDDLAFRNLLLESGVLSAKEETRWVPDALFTLVQGPLRNARRLEEATRATKFMRRVLAFYHPFALRFSDLPKDPVRPPLSLSLGDCLPERELTARLPSSLAPLCPRPRPHPMQLTDKWVELGCELVSMLVSSPVGVQFLLEDKLLPQLAEAPCTVSDMHRLTTQRRRRAAHPSSSPRTGSTARSQAATSPCSASSRARKQARGASLSPLITRLQLSRLTRAPRNSLLDELKLWTAFYRIAEMRNREDLVRLIIDNIDYSTCV